MSPGMGEGAATEVGCETPAAPRPARFRRPRRTAPFASWEALIRSGLTLRSRSTCRVKRRLVVVICQVTTAKASDTMAMTMWMSLKDQSKLPTTMLRINTTHTQAVHRTEARSSSEARRLMDVMLKPAGSLGRSPRVSP